MEMNMAGYISVNISQKSDKPFLYTINKMLIMEEDTLNYGTRFEILVQPSRGQHVQRENPRTFLSGRVYDNVLLGGRSLGIASITACILSPIKTIICPVCNSECPMYTFYPVRYCGLWILCAQSVSMLVDNDGIRL